MGEMINWAHALHSSRFGKEIVLKDGTWEDGVRLMWNWYLLIRLVLTVQTSSGSMLHKIIKLWIILSQTQGQIGQFTNSSGLPITFRGCIMVKKLEGLDRMIHQYNS